MKTEGNIMKLKNTLAAGVLFTASALGVAVPVVHAEVSASVSAANMYYFRGADLGNGDAALSADINYSVSGFTVGAWTSSGDATNGTEYDIYAGYEGSVGDFSYGAGAIAYIYPEVSIRAGDYTEAYLTLGYAGFEAHYYKAVTGGDYNYFTVSYAYEQFSLLYGQHEGDASHLDFTYTYNDNLSFTLGKVLEEKDYYLNDEAKFVVSLTLPIK
jgi:uncharacterized protein (TIGR02001 family)